MVVATVGVTVGIVFGLKQVRDLVKQRQTQLFMQLYDRLNSREFQEEYNEIVYLQEWKDYDDYMSRDGPETNFKAWTSLNSIGYFFDGLGVLVRRRLIDISLVDDLMSSSIFWLWEKMEPIIRERRKRKNRPQIWEWVEYLYGDMKARESFRSVA